LPSLLATRRGSHRTNEWVFSEESVVSRGKEGRGREG